jgi:hypothetical protein
VFERSQGMRDSWGNLDKNLGDIQDKKDTWDNLNKVSEDNLGRTVGYSRGSLDTLGILNNILDGDTQDMVHPEDTLDIEFGVEVDRFVEEEEVCMSELVVVRMSELVEVGFGPGIVVEYKFVAAAELVDIEFHIHIG